MLVWYLGVQAERRVAVCRKIIKFVTFPDCMISRVHPHALIDIFCHKCFKPFLSMENFSERTTAIASVRLYECFIVYTRRAQNLEPGGHGIFFFTGATNIFRNIAIPFLTFKSIYQLT